MIEIYTDGACSPNPGDGGWAAIILGEKTIKIFGYEANTTNNKMELLAVIKALHLTNSNDTIKIYTDSVYVMHAFTEGWLENWKKKDWKKVKNRELWEELDLLVSKRTITWQWVKGHSGNKYNEMVDKMAVEARQQI